MHLPVTAHLVNWVVVARGPGTDRQSTLSGFATSRDCSSSADRLNVFEVWQERSIEVRKERKTEVAASCGREKHAKTNLATLRQRISPLLSEQERNLDPVI